MTAAGCVRRAWLELGALVMQLHDEAGGYFVTELDLGSPDVRDVSNNRPDAHGLDDRTQYFGGRVVSVTLTAVAEAGASIDGVAASFGPFMVPSVRPELHYVLDRPGLPERVMTLRAQAYAYKVDNPDTRDVQLSWVAADPTAYDPVEQSGVARTGAGGAASGRAYNLRPDRIYPAGSSAPAGATLYSPGDLPVRPLLRIYGPVTGGSVRFVANAAYVGAVALSASYVIAAGHYVEVDCDARTAYLDGKRDSSVLVSLDWATMQIYKGWPIIPARTNTGMYMYGSSTTTATQTVATWNDGYLS